ncbi:MAG TPA: MFS transporter [Pseudomonadales bacterium]
MATFTTDTVEAAGAGATAEPAAPRLPSSSLFLYALPTIPIAALLFPIGFFLPPFFTGELGLSLNAWALILFIARVWDIGTDPVVGIVCDRLPSRWGRRRHWLVIGTPLLMAGCLLLFIPQLFVERMTLVYALVALCLLQLGQTIYGLNQSAWGAELSDDYFERSRIQGWRAAVGGVAPLVAFGIPMVIERTSDAPEVANGEKLFYIALFVLVTLPVFTTLAVGFVKERSSRVASGLAARLGLRESWWRLIRNRIMLRLIVIDVFAALPFSIATAINFFYVAYVLEAPAVMSSVLVVVFIVGLASMPMWVRISQRFEKHRILTVAYLVGAALSTLLALLGPGDVIAYAVIACALAVFTSGPMFILRSIVADVVDSDIVDTGEERAGTFYALVEMTAKFAPAIAVPLVFPFLTWMGFDPALGLDNSPTAIAALKYAFVLFPPIPMLIAAYLLHTFPLGRSEQEALREQIERVHGRRD